MRDLAVALIGLGGRHIDDATPCVDVRLEGGIRVHAVLPPVAAEGTAISIRVPRLDAPDLATLEARGMFDARMRERCSSDAVARRENLLVTGAAGAGKTTLLAALLGRGAGGERIVTIEDVAELRIDHPHHVRLEARQANLEGAGAIGLARLVREALRMRPDRLVVGECRGEEVRELLSALNTGHDGGAGTLHANGLRRRAGAARGARRARRARRPRPRASGGERDRARAACRAGPTASDGSPRRVAPCSAPPDASGSRRSTWHDAVTTDRRLAETVLRLAVLLQAGVAPARAWAYLAEAGDPSRRVCAAADAGVPLPRRSPPRRRLRSRADAGDRRPRGGERILARRRGRLATSRRPSARRSPRACARSRRRCATRRRPPTRCGSRSPSPPARRG